MGKSDRTARPGGMDFAIGLTNPASGNPITARKAGDIADLLLCISPARQPVALALRNLAKALNLALKSDFIETPLDGVYKASRVRNGMVEILHRDYIGLGDGIFASIGKAAKSFSLTMRGPDAASPEGRAWIQEHGRKPIGGFFNLLGRKLNLLQEFEDKVPVYVEQTLDRLEGARVVTDWHRNEWQISTTLIGLDVLIQPIEHTGE
ncbi:MAG: hypothetical protein ACYC0X_03595 [Pirellulaceae bacterium]